MKNQQGTIEAQATIADKKVSLSKSFARDFAKACEGFIENAQDIVDDILTTESLTDKQKQDITLRFKFNARAQTVLNYLKWCPGGQKLSDAFTMDRADKMAAIMRLGGYHPAAVCHKMPVNIQTDEAHDYARKRDLKKLARAIDERPSYL